jgi:hypothetical protein
MKRRHETRRRVSGRLVVEPPAETAGCQLTRETRNSTPAGATPFPSVLKQDTLRDCGGENTSIMPVNEKVTSFAAALRAKAPP